MFIKTIVTFITREGNTLLPLRTERVVDICILCQQMRYVYYIYTIVVIFNKLSQFTKRTRIEASGKIYSQKSLKIPKE